MTRAWWAVLWMACSGTPSEPVDVEVDREQLAVARAAHLRDRVARELDCEGPTPPLLCSLSALGEGARPSWPSGSRSVRPTLAFGIRPSRPLVHGALQTADVVMAVMGDGGVALLGLSAPDGELRDRVMALRRELGRALMPDQAGEAALKKVLSGQDGLIPSSEVEAVVLDAVRPGKVGWVAEEGVWFALPPSAAPARWARVDVHGEGTRVVMVLQPMEPSVETPAQPAAP